jgi:hypothetical protein
MVSARLELFELCGSTSSEPATARFAIVVVPAGAPTVTVTTADAPLTSEPNEHLISAVPEHDPLDADDVRTRAPPLV